MADFLGRDIGADEPTAIDFLGRPVPVAFKAQPALPAGGPVTGGGAPATVGGGGTTVAGGPGLTVSGGGVPGRQEANTLLQALGISRKALDSADWARKLFGVGEGEGAIRVPDSVIQGGARFSDEPFLPAARATSIPPTGAPGLTPADAALGAEAEGGSVAVGDAAAGTSSLGTAADAASSAAASAGPAILAAIALEDLMRVIQSGDPETANTPIVGDTLRGVSRLSKGDPKGALGLVPGAAFAEDLITQGPRAIPLIGGLFDDRDPLAAKHATERADIGREFAPALQNILDTQNDLQRVASGELSPEDANRLAGRAAGGGQQVSSFYSQFGTPEALSRPVDLGDGLSFPSMSQFLQARDYLTMLRTSDAMAKEGGTAPHILSPGEGGRLLSYAGPQFDPNAPGYAGANPYYSQDQIDPAFMQAFVPGSQESALVDYASRINPEFAGTPLAWLLANSPTLGASPREPDPDLPAAPPSQQAMEQLAAFGLLPGGGATRGEEVLESA